MVEVEKRGGIFRSVRAVIELLTRDHTEQDVRNAQRVLTGEITPENRREHRAKMISRIIYHTLGGSAVTIPTTDPSFLNPLLPACIAMVREIEQLPDEQIDQRIRLGAAQDLARWQQPKT